MIMLVVVMTTKMISWSYLTTGTSLSFSQQMQTSMLSWSYSGDYIVHLRMTQRAFFDSSLISASLTVTLVIWSWCLDLRYSFWKTSQKVFLFIRKDHVGVALDYGSNQQQHVVKCFAQVTEVRDEQERIASLLVAILVLGIGAGSFLSYPIVNCLW